MCVRTRTFARMLTTIQKYLYTLVSYLSLVKSLVTFCKTNKGFIKMKANIPNSVSSSLTASVRTVQENTLLECPRCKNFFSILALHNGYCFNCSVERFKEKELKALGFDYIPRVLNGKDPQQTHIVTKRRKLKSWNFRGVF